ncbi:MAG: cell division protein ZapA [Burkholderiales bacterium]|nr:cell division protein ZapA [Burkholderiales bacterium]
MDVIIMGRPFRVACEEGEEGALLDAVAYLDRKMSEIRDSGKLAGTDRIAVMAALNVAHELLTVKTGGVEIGEYKRRMNAMKSSLEKAMIEQDELF